MKLYFSKKVPSFPLFSILEPLMQRNLMLNFWGDCDVTSSFGLPGKFQLEFQSLDRDPEIVS